MTILWSNNASTTISGSITPASTSVQLAAGTGVLFPSPTGGNFYVATFYDQATKTINEIVHVTAMSGDIATIVRAQEGTTARSWNAGDLFANLVTAGTLNNFVQAGTGPANTSVVYVGTDTSAIPNLIVATTNPVPASLATGMLFNIWVKNSNTGSVTLQLNGGTALAATRQNGAAMVGGDLTATEEMIFVYNGVNFTAMVPNISHQPPVTTFYVNPAGNDSNTGFANTPTDAFATLYGAVNAISSRYISQNQITIRIADGTYIGGASIAGGYIASWNIIGNSANPGNVVIDATTASPPAGALPGVSVEAISGGNATCTGMTFKSYNSNAAASGATLWCVNCNFTGPTSGVAGPIFALQGGTLVLQGNCSYNPSGYNAPCIFLASTGGFVSLGFASAYGNRTIVFNIVGSPVVTAGTALGEYNGVISLVSSCVTWTGGTPSGPKYQALLGGGIWTGGFLSAFPGSSAGIVTSPGWAN